MITPRLVLTVAGLAALTAAPAGVLAENQLTAPLGSTKGSYIDASQVYGSEDSRVR
jgi:hypothetical protein